MTAGVELCSLREIYVLDGLTAGERAEFEQHLQSCATCQAEVASLRDVATYLLYDFPDVTPPEGMRERVLDALFADEPAVLTPATMSPANSSPDDHAMDIAIARESEAVSVARAPEVSGRAHDEGWTTSGRSSRRSRQRTRWWPALAGVVTAASLAWAITLQLTQPNVPSPVGQVVQATSLSPQSTMASARAKVWVNQAPTGKNMYLQFSGLQPVHGSQVYQIWLVREAKDGLQVYSAGVFKPSNSGDAVFTFALPRTAYSIVAVTLEPKAIDKTPLGPKVLVGQMNV